MKWHHTPTKLYVKIEQNLNLNTTRLIRRVAEDKEDLLLDLSQARIVDSEGVIFMYRWLREGKKLTLFHPPRILWEIVKILQLESVLPLDQLCGDHAAYPENP